MALFALAETSMKGRVVAATSPLNANEIVLKERPIGIALYSAARDRFCAYCTNKLPAQGRVPCNSCKKLFYCNSKCREADSIAHMYECRAFKELNEAFTEDSDSLFLLRIISTFGHNE
jgi:hypothetical protein